MKNTYPLLVAIACVLLLTSCEHAVTSETTVHTDGSLDRKFVFERRDTIYNIMGLRPGAGWKKTVFEKDTSDTRIKDKLYRVTFEKTFGSAEEANRELAQPSDSLLRVTSVFEKRFQWFYTYMRYSETIHAVNWLHLKPHDFLVQEDYAFIDRLPAEGKPISKGDEFYLSELNKRMYDSYGARAILEEYMSLGSQLLTDHGVDQRWIDTLTAHKEELFIKMKSERIDMKNFVSSLDSLGIPLDTAAVNADYKRRNLLLEKKLSFISNASEGKYKYIMHFPWSITQTNADSIAGETLVWAPPSIKFLVKDYTMYGESRKPNYGLWLLSASLVIFTLYLFLRPRAGVSS